MLQKISDLFTAKKPPVASTVLPQYHSQFGGLWTDQLDAKAVLEKKAADSQAVAHLKEKLTFFIENGFVIFEGAIDHSAIDAYLAELDVAYREGGGLLASVPVQGPQDKDVVPLKDADLGAPLTKVLDTYFHLPSAHKLIFSAKIQEFLSIVFEDGLLAFQGLHFEKGSTQSIHQDTAYVVLEEPMKLCASWVALEDVKPGSGELIYYPGSHRLPDWLYSGKHKHFNHGRDKHEEHMSHLQALHDRSKERGLTLQSFLPKKGDFLIWSADLAHGGSQLGDDPSVTRRSLVTHYAPAASTPFYFRFIADEKREKHEVKPGCMYSSFYY